MSEPKPQISPRSLDGDVSASVVRARDAFGSLAKACGAGPRGVDITRRMGLDKSLAWHLSSLISAQDLGTVVEHLPGVEGVDLILRAASRLGVDGGLCDEVRSATAALRACQERCAGSRASFIALLGSVSGAAAGPERSLAAARREAFIANVAIFGLRAEAQYQIDCLWLDEPTGLIGVATLHGWRGLSRLRPEARVRLGSFRAERGEVAEQFAGALDPGAAARAGAPIVERFCAGPIAPFAAHPDVNGMRTIYVGDGALGLDGAVDLAMGQALRSAFSPSAARRGERAELFARVGIPAMLLVHECLIDERLIDGAWRGRGFGHELISELAAGGHFPVGRDWKSRLMPRRKMDSLGRADQAPAPAGLEPYRAMVDWLCAGQGLAPGRLRSFRVVIEHPPVPTTSLLSLELPELSAGE